jgi:hypothetical protein
LVQSSRGVPGGYCARAVSGFTRHAYAALHMRVNNKQ